MASASFPHSLGVLSRLAAERAARAGLDVTDLKTAANLPLDLEKSDARVSARGQSVFLSLVAAALGDDLLGFHIALEFDLRQIGPLFYVMASSPTLREALAREERYTWTVTEGLRNIVREGKHLVIETRFVGLERHVDKHQIEFWFTCTLRKVRLLTGEQLVPDFVEWVHPRTVGVDEIRRYFGVLPTFGARWDRLAFPAEAADLPFTDPDPHLSRFLLNVLDDIGTARETRSNPLRTRVENAITPRLPHAMISQEAVARELGLSKRTLIRRLAEEGLSFRQILDELRARLAREYLDAGLPQAQVAWLLGFREPKGFARAFRRWTGASPGSFRRRERSPRDLDFGAK